jgi:phosphoglycolate phosphatase-like HAD superfamily hydrolase
MKVFKTNQMVPFDVDDTLIMWHAEDLSKAIQIDDPYIKGCTYNLVPHEGHIQLMKKYKARGFTIVVWSAGGVDWAENVVKALKLEEFVDAVFTKPCRYVDDLKCSEWMGNQVYIK